MEKNTIVQLKGSKIQMLLPQGFERLKMKNPIKDALNRITSDFVGYRKTVEYSDNIVLFKKISEEEAMNPDDRTELINGIHECLSDTQGIVEVKNGITVNGEKYIYSIVKNLVEETRGIRYFLRLDIFGEDIKDIVEIQADFTEIRMTGVRESTTMVLARKAGLVTFEDNMIKGWAEDPYDSGFTRGALKNLAEKEGLDAMFPGSPLSQAHEFLRAVINNEYVLIKKANDNEEENSSSSSDKTDEDDRSDVDRQEQEKELLKKLFVDECLRYTVSVKLE